MLISSMGRYAVLILLDLAEHRGGFVPVRQIAERQELSQKYLERILRTLAEHGLVEGTHGKGGGYRLTREPSAPDLLGNRRNLGLMECLLDQHQALHTFSCDPVGFAGCRNVYPFHPGHRRRSG